MAGPFSEAAIGARLDGALRSLVGGSGAGAPAPAAPPLTTMAWLRHDQILDQVAARRPASVLEVGAGQGAMGWRLAGQADYVGLEPDERSSAVAAERLRGRGEIRTGGLECLGGAERFDMVCAFEVLEHIDDDIGALRAWRERLHPGGSLLISVPAHRARFGRSDEAVGHFRRYDRSDLAETIAAAGFDDIDIRPYGAVLGPALERVRNGVLAVRPPSDDTGGTSGSGRLLQPDHRVTASAMRGVAAPFRRLQRTRVGHRGVGWVAVATRRSD